MFAHHFESRRHRRGVVLILILGMLGLMALVGVTFATFSGQSRIGALKFAEGAALPTSDQVMDFGMSQLILGTDNVLSAIRGHDLARDMYGNDANTNGFLSALPNGENLYILQGTQPPGTNYYQVAVNVPVSYYPTLNGVNFARWYLRISPMSTVNPNNGTGAIYNVAQTFEVIIDDATGSNPLSQVNDPYSGVPGPMHVLTLGPAVGTPMPSDTLTGLPYNNNGMGLPANLQDGAIIGGTKYPYNGNPVVLNQPIQANGQPTIDPSTGLPPPIVLDGRFRRAFNGPGMAGYGNIPDTAGVVRSAGQFPNFRINGNLLTGNGNTPALGNPDLIGMDEDYDACDLENWFLAIQSADGQVVIPSFHRPGIITVDPNNNVNDWLNPAPSSAAKILRPRGIDNPAFSLSYPDPTPAVSGPNMGKITYDVDNDGDGITDSVWLDLGYPAQRDPSGKLYKPLFSFMVLGLNGRLPLNTAGNLQGRDYTPSGNNPAGSGNPPPPYTFDMPNWTHASHLGYSVSEIDPTFALQNAFAGYDPNGNLLYGQTDNGISILGATYNPSGVPVSTTQLRNLLTGTRPQNSLYALDGANGDSNAVQMGVDANSNPIYWYMPNNIIDLADASRTRSTAPVPGRWGEPEGVPQILPDPTNPIVQSYPNYLTFYNPLDFTGNPVRAGRSNYLPQYQTINTNPYVDSSDDDYNTDDIWPKYQTNAPEDLDHFDVAGALDLPVERIRRFLVPVDVAGTGRVMDWSSPGAANQPGNASTLPAVDFGNGYDNFGRVGFFRYFRPPGVPGQVAPTPFTPPGYPGPSYSVINSPANLVNATPPYTTTNQAYNNTNAYHGYESWRNGYSSDNNLGANLQAARTNAAPYTQSSENTYPTYLATDAICTYDPITPATTEPGPNPNPNLVFPNAIYNGYVGGSLARDTADEMNLYVPNHYDMPFGVGDLEWLYRKHDIDGGSLDSRLAKLAPISFLNPIDGVTRRRLFSVDVWDTNNFVWAYDNPGNAFPNNSRFRWPPAAVPVNNVPPVNASFETLNIAGFANPNLPNWQYSQPAASPVPAGSVMHRDRKINLNFPLPVSNDPNEPVRQKWIRETYYTLKAILPPESVDTPGELAQLSQFVTNIIDFRDPDATMTTFTNPDVVWVPASSPTTPASLAFAWSPPTGVTTYPLVQFGMEYQPIAINEVLGYSFLYLSNPTSNPPGPPAQQNRLFIELVNTLTADGSYARGASSISASDLDLNGWQLTLVADDAYGRPDPTTGQYSAVNLYPSATTWPTAQGPSPTFSAGSYYVGNGALVGGASAPLQNLIPSLTGGAGRGDSRANYYYVLGNTLIDPNSETGSPPISTPSPTLDAMLNYVAANDQPGTNFPQENINPTGKSTGSGNGRFYWLYLSRPANPLDPTNASGNSPQVVVDSIRFPFIDLDTTGWAQYNKDPVTGKVYYTVQQATAHQQHSVQRAQPYRGGQRIPYALGTPPVNPGPYGYNPYGYSEQTAAPATVATTLYGRFNTLNKGYQNITMQILHTLGAANNFNVNGTATVETWDYVPFHDRDFMNVAELLLVPGCPPGLFTKQFAEQAPIPAGASLTPNPFPPTPASVTVFDNNSLQGGGGAGTGNYYTTCPPVYPNAGTVLPAAGKVNLPHPYPYLPDQFYYTAMDPSYTPPGSTMTLLATVQANNTNYPGGVGVVGGPTSGGWHKMFELFEVPSSSFGAIGQVAVGNNFDWFRQDLRPGQININLIIDEEVFFGLIDEETRLNLTEVTYDESQSGANYPNPYRDLPQVVTQVNAYGYPSYSGFSPVDQKPILTGAYPITDRGFYNAGAVTGVSLNVNPYGGNSPLPSYARLKAAFIDFLKLRHGGSGFLFAFGGGPVGSGPAPVANSTINPPATVYQTPVAMERPYHSLSYPDIDFTLMRPASLPPSTLTTPVANANPSGAASNYCEDPGLKNPYLNPPSPQNAAPALGFSAPPQVPPRRLFQIPDFYVDGTGTNQASSNASQMGQWYVNQQITHPNLDNYNPTTTPPYIAADLTTPVAPGGATTSIAWLGAGNGAGGNDERQHPYYRSEWLQKMMNLTTVRTHQYAVWVTVGFFEVVRPGNPALAIPDQLGQEIPLGGSGRITRYRSFFIVDRTRAIGYGMPPSAVASDNFRDRIIYRRRIQ
jgi:hypothetical protein